MCNLYWQQNQNRYPVLFKLKLSSSAFSLTPGIISSSQDLHFYGSKTSSQSVLVALTSCLARVWRGPSGPGSSTSCRPLLLWVPHAPLVSGLDGEDWSIYSSVTFGTTPALGVLRIRRCSCCQQVLLLLMENDPACSLVTAVRMEALLLLTSSLSGSYIKDTEVCPRGLAGVTPCHHWSESTALLVFI